MSLWSSIFVCPARMGECTTSGNRRGTLQVFHCGGRKAIRVCLAFALLDLIEKEDQPLGHCRMSEDCVAQDRERESPDHRGLNCRHQLASLDTKSGEPNNFVALLTDQHLHKT